MGAGWIAGGVEEGLDALGFEGFGVSGWGFWFEGRKGEWEFGGGGERERGVFGQVFVKRGEKGGKGEKLEKGNLRMGRWFDRLQWGRPSVSYISPRGRAGRVVGRRLQTPCRSLPGFGGRIMSK